jgi:hypothetical protein
MIRRLGVGRTRNRTSQAYTMPRMLSTNPNGISVQLAAVAMSQQARLGVGTPSSGPRPSGSGRDSVTLTPRAITPPAVTPGAVTLLACEDVGIWPNVAVQGFVDAGMMTLFDADGARLDTSRDCEIRLSRSGLAMRREGRPRA